MGIVQKEKWYLYGFSFSVDGSHSGTDCLHVPRRYVYCRCFCILHCPGKSVDVNEIAFCLYEKCSSIISGGILFGTFTFYYTPIF